MLIKLLIGLSLGEILLRLDEAFRQISDLLFEFANPFVLRIVRCFCAGLGGLGVPPMVPSFAWMSSLQRGLLYSTCRSNPHANAIALRFGRPSLVTGIRPPSRSN